MSDIENCRVQLENVLQQNIEFRNLLQDAKDALQRKCASEDITKLKALVFVLTEIEGANMEISYQTSGYGNGNSTVETERYLVKLNSIKNTLYEELDIDDRVVPPYLQERFDF